MATSRHKPGKSAVPGDGQDHPQVGAVAEMRVIAAGQAEQGTRCLLREPEMIFAADWLLTTGLGSERKQLDSFEPTQTKYHKEPGMLQGEASDQNLYQPFLTDHSLKGVAAGWTDEG